MVNELIANRFRPEGPAKGGGQKDFLKAYDTLLNCPVALKKLRPDVAQDPELRHALKQEGIAVRKIGSHPGIATVYDLVPSDGELYIVEEFVEGVTLREYLGPGQILPTAEIVQVGMQVADALAAAHHHGVVHRDLKPENIMITEAEGGERRAKIIDFGLAKVAGPLDESEASRAETEDGYVPTGPLDFKGTLLYSAPEQIPGPTRGAVGPATDLYALGLVLYEMATGTNPFVGSTAKSIFNNIRTLQPPPLRERNPDAPHELDRILRKCLQKRPEQRYKSAHDLHVDLENVMTHKEWSIAAGLARTLFLLIQITYLVMYGVALRRIQDIPQAAASAHCEYLAWPLIACAIIGGAVRLYFLAGVSFDYPDSGRQFHWLFPLIFLLDILWAASPLLLWGHLQGLVFLAGAALAFLPFSQRWLLYTRYAPGGGHASFAKSTHSSFANRKISSR